MTFEELATLSIEAASKQGVDLRPVIKLWLTCIALGAMTEADAITNFMHMLEECQLPEDSA